MSFPAKYRSICRLCEQAIDFGDQITGVEDGYAHDVCARDALADERPLDVCPKCFLVKPCECEES